jgi:DNA-binding MarR family transcriptional regulator
MKKLRSPKREQQTKQAFQNMKRILLAFRARVDEEFRPQGVTLAQLQVLFAVRAQPQSSGAQLARTCYITPQTAQSLLKHLENRGLIVRGKDSVNDRIVTTSLTAAGERLAQLVEKSSMPLRRDLWQGITDRELDQLNDVLARCLANLGAGEQPLSPR